MNIEHHWTFDRNPKFFVNYPFRQPRAFCLKRDSKSAAVATLGPLPWVRARARLAGSRSALDLGARARTQSSYKAVARYSTTMVLLPRVATSQVPGIAA